MPGIELQQRQKLELKQKPVLTQQQQLAIKLLQLPRLELIELIRQEMETNPVLEDVQGSHEDEDAQQPDQISAAPDGAGPEVDGGESISATEVKGGKEIDWERYLENSSLLPVIPVYRGVPDEELPGVESAPSREESLYDHLMRQVRLSNYSHQEERLAALIIGNLDDFGYFREDPEAEVVLEGHGRQTASFLGEGALSDSSGHWGAEGVLQAAGGGVAEVEEGVAGRSWGTLPSTAPAGEGIKSDLGLLPGSGPPEGWGRKRVTLEALARDAGVTLQQAEDVLRRIQRLDPIGVAARSLEECLLVQAEAFGFGAVEKEIISRHLKNLWKRNYAAVARDMNLTLEEVMEAVKRISTLEPKPARNFTGDPPQYVVPDVYVERVDGDSFIQRSDDHCKGCRHYPDRALWNNYVVKMNDDGLPKLKVSDLYRRYISDPATKSYIKEKLRNAHWLVQSIEQRRKTIIRVTECIVCKQREFMEKGPAYLKRMKLEDVANSLNLHPSTISRVTSNKYVHTPQGIFALKYFFDKGISRLPTSDDEVSSESVKNRIREIIAGEDSSLPLSDQQIVAQLAKEGIMIARRTVAKYRDLLGILPSNQRKKI